MYQYLINKEIKKEINRITSKEGLFNLTDMA